jgi:hypothetical protein
MRLRHAVLLLVLVSCSRESAVGPSAPLFSTGNP